MCRIPESYELYDRYAEQQEKLLEERPVCYYCDNHIQESFCFTINDEDVCVHCLNEYFRRELD